MNSFKHDIEIHGRILSAAIQTAVVEFGEQQSESPVVKSLKNCQFNSQRGFEEKNLSSSPKYTERIAQKSQWLVRPYLSHVPRFEDVQNIANRFEQCEPNTR